MTMIIAALMLGAVVSPPPEGDDDTVMRKPQSVDGRALDEDDKEQKGALGPQAPVHETDEDDEAGRVPSSTIVITARRLDTARTQIDAGLGATVYSLTNETIENRPGGETGSISEVLSQTPGVTLSGNQLNVRGSRANQVRINNVIVPEAISDPADHLSSRLAETSRLITGTLPAQFGFAPAGVISITTKNGLYQHGGQAELFAGTDGMAEPAVEWAGSLQRTSLFASGSLEHDHSTLADAEGITARDRRSEVEGLGFADHVIDENNRMSVIFGGSRERHKIGQTSIASGIERTSDGYAVGTFQRTDNDFTVQASLFAGVASDQARFNQSTHERRGTYGTQIDATDTIGTSHILRFGLLASRSTARELELGGGRSSASRTSAALYAQDAWKVTPSVTLNPGARVEWLRGFGSGATLEPRASLVWQSGHGLTGHLGYARYSSAPPLGELPSGSRLPDERDDYFDAGIQQRVGAFTLGVDGYSRQVRNYIAERDTVGSAVPTAFGFKRAKIRGLEFSATYVHRGTTAWANVSFANARARTIIDGESLFGPAVIAAAAMRRLPLASERPVTVSGGLTEQFGKLSLGFDILVSSGAVRTLDLAEPNGSRHSPYALIGLAAVYHARIGGQRADLRLDVNNLTNVHYLTSDAANLEGGWTRQGRGRALTIGIEQSF
jgi:outer membrane cobalamin receptor